MSRRVAVVVAVVVALAAGRLSVTRGVRAVSAGRVALASAPPKAFDVPSAASEGSEAATPVTDVSRPAEAGFSERLAATRNEAAQGDNGVSDVDPHKAFGSKNAPIVMEVFSDYQCPACRQLFLTTNRQIMDNYVSTGKVYLIHRDFPLAMHAYSRVAARYARAAADIGKVEQVEKALFENQDKWEQTGDVDGTVAAVLTPAEMTKVRALVKGGTLEPLIDKDFQLGQMYRVNQTPTSVFHSKGQTYPYSGVMSYDILHQFLDQLLSQR